MAGGDTIQSNLSRCFVPGPPQPPHFPPSWPSVTEVRSAHRPYLGEQLLLIVISLRRRVQVVTGFWEGRNPSECACETRDVHPREHRFPACFEHSRNTHLFQLCSQSGPHWPCKVCPPCSVYSFTNRLLSRVCLPASHSTPTMFPARLTVSPTH